MESHEQEPRQDVSAGDADELLRRALIDAEDAAAVALPIDGLPLSRALTLIFHGRRDLGTIHTYVTAGGRHAGDRISFEEMLRVPCDLDLAEAEDRDAAERLYAEQAAAMKDALVGADTVLDLWREPLESLAGDSIRVSRSIELDVALPAHRVLPVALVAPERHVVVAAVCGARTLAAGRPPLGIACAQQDVAHIYALPDDPERCLDDFMTRAADHARSVADHLDHKQASVDRFLELNDDLPEAG